MTAVANSTLNLGFLTVLEKAGAFSGGYLVTNQWGRPLEFRLSSAVQPNRVQQVLYAQTLEPYVCADLIGKTLVEKTPIDVDLIITDVPALLELRLRLDTPVVFCSPDLTDETGTIAERSQMQCHADFPNDSMCVEEILAQIVGIDLREPFQRIREAMTEAKRLGIKK